LTPHFILQSMENDDLSNAIALFGFFVPAVMPCPALHSTLPWPTQQAPATSSPLGPNTFLNTTLSNTLASILSSVRDQGSIPIHNGSERHYTYYRAIKILYGSDVSKEAPACPSGKGRVLGSEGNVMRKGPVGVCSGGKTVQAPSGGITTVKRPASGSRIHPFSTVQLLVTWLPFRSAGCTMWLRKRMGGWLTSRFSRFTAVMTQFPVYRRLGGPQVRYRRVWEILPPPGFDPRTVQPIGSHSELTVSVNLPFND
jgi:hypothetical protein